MESELDKQGCELERPGFIGGLAQRLQQGVRATIEALGQSYAQRLAAIVETSDDAILSVDLEGTIATWNRGAEQLYGYEAEEIIGKPVNVLLPAGRQDEEPSIIDRVGRGEHVQHYETERLRKDGRVIPVSLSVSPIMDAAGEVIGASKIARDISVRKRTELALARRAEEQAALYEFTDRLFRATSAEDVYQAALDAIVRALDCERVSILLFDDSGVMKFVAWRGLSEGYRKAVEGHSPWTKGARDPEPITVNNIDAADLSDDLRATVKAEDIAALAFIPLTARGELIGKFMTYYRAPHAFLARDMELAVTIARQLGFSLERQRAEDERSKAEEAKALLVAESQHRIKNTLATVQAIASQTMQVGSAHGLEAFLSRLRALGEAHELLTIENWHRAFLRDVVERAVIPFQASGQERFIVDGPNVWLPAQTSLMLTLCLHELATNAAKYGALSNGTGRVRVSWELAADVRTARLIWLESGGPPVVAPERQGFGSRLIEATGDGENRLDYRPDGLCCLMKLGL